MHASKDCSIVDNKDTINPDPHHWKIVDHDWQYLLSQKFGITNLSTWGQWIHNFKKLLCRNKKGLI